MKKVLSFYPFLYAFLLFATRLQAQSIEVQPSLAAAFEKAKAENKLVFVEYYHAECPVCKRLEPLFSDSLMRTFYNKNFVNYKMNTQKNKPEDSSFMYSVGLKPESVPIFFFFDKNKQFAHFSYTKNDVKYLLEIGEAALSPTERAANLASKYQAGDRSIRTLYAYSNLAELYHQDSLMVVLADDLFKSFPSANLGNKKSYTITKHCVTTIENGFFQYWMNHIELLQGFETGLVNGHKEKEELGKILSKSINSPASKTWDLEKIQSVKIMISKVELSDNPDAFLWQQEAALLLKAKRNDEAMQLLQRLLAHPKTEIKGATYYLDVFLSLLTEKKDLDTFKKALDEQCIKAKEAADKANFEKLNHLYLEKRT
jgi:thiol-disulfide isomerase/thioredoxin